MATSRFADFNDQSLDRIIAAQAKAPEKLNRDALYDDLVRCYEHYSRATSAAAFKRNKERLNGIHKYTGRLVSLMEEDASDLAVLRPISDTMLPQLKALLKLFEERYQAQVTPKDAIGRIKKRLSIDGSGLQALVGLWLPEVYKKHFGREPGASRNHADGSVVGPYVRFVLQVTKEFQVKCSSETIDAALRQHGKSR
jgi:hypothetical protein